MTPQEVIKSFMSALDTHTLKLSTVTEEEQAALMKKILDQAVTSSSHYKSMQELIDKFIADCAEYNKSGGKGSNAFLLEKCGIDLSNTSTGDTGAITGSDANITLTGDDGETVIGTGVKKTPENVVPEYGNYYEAMTSVAQSINTGTNGWIVKATTGNDTILSGGEDSINAGAGTNYITLQGSRATVDVASGTNSIFIGDNVKYVVLLNYDASKTTISGNSSVVNYEGTAAQVSNSDETNVFGDGVWIEDENKDIAPTVEGAAQITTNGDLAGDPPSTPTTQSTRRLLTRSNADEGTAVSDIILGEGSDSINNYFNTAGTKTYSGNDTIAVDLSNAINPSNPVPAGGFIVSNSATTANFVSTNAAAKADGVSMVGKVGSIYPELMSFTFRGLTLNVKDRRLKTTDGNYVQIKSFDNFDDVGTKEGEKTYTYTVTNADKTKTEKSITYTDEDNTYEKYVVASIYKWWMKEGLKLNYEDYGYSFEDPDATQVVINLHFDKTIGGSNALAAVSSSYYPLTGKTVSLDLTVNKDYYDHLKDCYNDVNGKGNILLDRTLAHEFTHALMAAKEDYFYLLPDFIAEGMAEVTHGIDDKRTSTIQELAANSTLLGNVITITQKPDTSNTRAYAGGYMFLRYFAKQTALATQNTFVPSQMEYVTVNLTGDGTYYVGNNSSLPTATTTTGTYSVGSAASNAYTLNSAFKQFITTTGETSWKIEDLYSNNTLKSSSGADTVNTTGDNNSIDAGDGANQIAINNGTQNTVTAGTGDDLVTISGGSNNTVNVGDGNDFVTISGGSNNTVNVGDGANLVSLYSGTQNTVTAGTGNDSLLIQYGSSHTINVGNGINLVSIDGSKGNSVVAGEGNDQLITSNNINNANNFLDAGAGNDNITVGAGTNSTFLGGTGNDVITFLNFTNSDNAQDTTAITDNYVDAGEGDDSIRVFGSNNTVLGGAGDDTVYEGSEAGNYIDLGDGNDSIALGGANNTIIGGAGNDNIYQYSNSNGGNVYLYDTEGFGADTISGFMSTDKISLAADFTYDYSNNVVTVKKGTATVGTIRIALTNSFNADTNIVKAPSTVPTTIDLTIVDGYYQISSVADLKTLATFVNAGGDTSDKKFKLTADIDMSSAGDFTAIGSYSNDKAFKGTFDGDGKKISNLSGTLFGYVSGGTVTNILVDGTGTISDSLFVAQNDNGTLNKLYYHGYTGTDSNATAVFTVTVNGATATVSEGNTVEFGGTTYYTDGTKLTLTATKTGYTVTESVTVTKDDAISATLDTSKTYVLKSGEKYTLATAENTKEYPELFEAYKITLPTGATASGDLYATDDANTAYVQPSKTVTISNFKSGDISFDSTVTSLEQSGNNVIAKTKDGTAFTISGLEFSKNEGETSWTVNGTSATYSSTTATAGAEISGTKITYKDAGTSTTFTLTKSTGTWDESKLKAGVGISDKTVTITDKELLTNGATLTITSGYTVKLADTLAPSDAVTEGWDGTSYYSADGYKTGGWTLGTDGKLTQVSAATAVVTVSGLKSGVKLTNENIKVGTDNTVTILKAELLEGVTKITADNNYTVKLDSTLNPTETEAGFGSDSSLVYKSKSNTGGYTIDANGNVTHTDKVDATTLFTLSGIKSSAGVKVDGTNVIIPQDVLDGKDVTIEGTGYKLNLGTGITAPTTTAAKFDGLTYKSASNTAGYTLDETNNKITYTAAKTATDLFTLTNVKTDGIVVNDTAKTVTLKSDNLTQKDVTFSANSGGYKFVLDGVDAPKDTEAHFNELTYKSASKTEGYKLSDDKKSITYTAAVEEKDLFTLTGVTGTSGITVNDKTVTIPNAVLSQNNTVTISSNDYELALGSDVTESTSSDEKWSGSGSEYTYTAAGTSAGYTLADNKITYSDKTGGETFTISGIKSTSGVTVNDKKVTVASAALNETKVTITTSDGYALELDSGVKAPEATEAGWDNLTYKAAGKTAGYKLEGGEIVYSAAEEGATLFTLTNVKDTSSIAVDTVNKTVTLKAANLTGKDVTISGDYTLALDTDVPTTSEGEEAAWTSSGENSYTYKDKANPAYYTLDETNNKITYTEASGGTNLFTITGVQATDKIKVDTSAKTVTLTSDSLTKANVSITGDYKLELSGVSASTSKTAGFEGFTYKSASNTEGYALSTDGKSVTYTAPVEEKDLFTLTGVTGTSGITVSGNTVTIPNAVLNQKEVTINNSNYKLALGNDVTKPTSGSAGWSGSGSSYTYKTAGTTAGYTLADNKITYSDGDGGESFTISGIKSTSGVTVSGKKVTVASSALNKVEVNLTSSDGYNLALDGSVTQPKDYNESWSGSGSSYTHTAGGTTAGYTISGNTISYTEASGGEKFTINGIKSTDGVYVNDKTVTVSDSALNEKNVTLSGTGYTLELSGASEPENFDAGWNGNTYRAKGNTAGYTLKGNTISYTAAKGGESFTLNGITNTDGVKVSGKTVTVTEDALGTKDVTISTSDGYSLALDSKVSKPTAIENSWSKSGNTYTYMTAGTTAGYTLSGNKITYSAQVGGEVFSLTGIKSTDGVSVNGKNVTLSSAALNGEAITLSGNGYKLAIDSTVPTTSTKVKAGWTSSGDTYTYKADYTPAYYKLSGNRLTYTAAKGGESFSLTGIKSTSGVKISGKKVTLTTAALNEKTVTISGTDGYTFALDSKVPKSAAIQTSWKKSGSNFTYTAAGNTAGYTLSGNKVTYAAASGGESFTLSGIKSANGVTVSGKTITVASSALDGKNVTLTRNNGYTLALDNNVSTSATTTPASFSAVSKGTATFTTASASDYYTLSGSKITYHAATGGNQIKISGLNTNATLAQVKNSIDVSKQTNGTYKITFKNADVLTTKAPAISAPSSVKYTVAVDSSLSSATAENLWTVSGTNATLRAHTDAIYTVKNNKVVYTAARNGSAQVVLNGLASGVNASAISLPSNGTLTLNSAVLGTRVSVRANISKYAINLTGNMSGKTFTGANTADTITVAASNAVVNGGAGNDVITTSGSNITLTGGSGADIFAYGGGKVTINDYGIGSDRISVTSAVQSYKISGKDVVLNFGGNDELTLKNGAGKSVTLVSGSGTTVRSYDTSAGIMNSAKTAITLNSSAKTFDATGYSGLVTINGSATSKAQITGNARANRIIAGTGGSTLNGGKGNDTLVGGSGADVFVFEKNSGNDTIQSCGSGDIISLTGGASLTSAKVTKGDTVLKVGNQSLTVKNSAEVVISDGGTQKTVSGGLIVGNDKKSLTFFADSTGTYDLGQYQNANASATKKAVNINGNSQNNSIIGGNGNDKLYGFAGNDTLWGGAGNDTLYGGAGNDTFVYKPGEGRDTIMDYTKGDMIQILGGNFSNSNFSRNTLTLTVGSGSLTLRNVTASTEFNINGSTYHVSGNKLTK